MDTFHKDRFSNGLLEFHVAISPISAQNKSHSKQAYKLKIRSVTSASSYIIVGTCWIAIDYYCPHLKRLKNPGVYDLDNIIKPILDSLVGPSGLILDDVLVDRVAVNWKDTHEEDYLSIEVSYPGLMFLEKHDLKIVKSKSGWCFPVALKLLDDPKACETICMHFQNWDSIKTEKDYIDILPASPLNQFIYFSKIKDRGYPIIELESLQ